MATILVVEDKKEHRRFICDALRSGDHEPLEAMDGLHAIEILRQDESDIDLVTLDYSMPGMNGAEFLKEMRRDPKIKEVRKRSGKEPTIPVVVITVFITAEEVIKMRVLADAFLPKPLDHKDILRTVEAVLRERGV